MQKESKRQPSKRASSGHGSTSSSSSSTTTSSTLSRSGEKSTKHASLDDVPLGADDDDDSWKDLKEFDFHVGMRFRRNPYALKCVLAFDVCLRRLRRRYGESWRSFAVGGVRNVRIGLVSQTLDTAAAKRHRHAAIDVATRSVEHQEERRQSERGAVCLVCAQFCAVSSSVDFWPRKISRTPLSSA